MHKQLQVKNGNFIVRVSFWLLLTLGLCFGSEREGLAEQAPRKMLKIIVEREGESSRFFVKNLEETEITVTFEMDLVNLKGSTNFPHTAAYPGQQTTEAFTLAPIQPDQKWDYTYTSYYTMGSCDARHDDSYVYSLPYATGTPTKSPKATTAVTATQGQSNTPLIGECPSALPCMPRAVALSPR